MFNSTQNIKPLSVGALILCMLAGNAAAAEAPIPNLVGQWSGQNSTYSDAKGYGQWQKTITIAEQKGRIFKGSFSYAAGTKHFFGVIYPDNISFTWVANDSKGYNHGRILSNGKISACYVEAGADATVGCVELSKKAPT